MSYENKVTIVIESLVFHTIFKKYPEAGRVWTTFWSDVILYCRFLFPLSVPLLTTIFVVAILTRMSYSIKNLIEKQNSACAMYELESCGESSEILWNLWNTFSKQLHGGWQWRNFEWFFLLPRFVLKWLPSGGGRGRGLDPQRQSRRRRRRGHVVDRRQPRREPRRVQNRCVPKDSLLFFFSFLLFE